MLMPEVESASSSLKRFVVERRWRRNSWIASRG